MKKSGEQKLNPYLAAALRAEYKCKLIKRIPEEEDPPHPLGITEEHYSDRSKCFTGPGGGVLWILADGTAAVVLPPETPPLLLQSLVEIAPQNMPNRKLEVSDVENFKEEARQMLEALRMGKAQFFRDIADAIKPRQSAVEIAETHAKSQRRKDDAVFLSIIGAAASARGCPPFDAILSEYRETRGNGSETPSAFKKRLTVRGFQWLCGD